MCGERLEIIKQSEMPAVERGMKGDHRRAASRRWREEEVSALARVIVRGNKI